MKNLQIEIRDTQCQCHPETCCCAPQTLWIDGEPVVKGRTENLKKIVNAVEGNKAPLTDETLVEIIKRADGYGVVRLVTEAGTPTFVARRLSSMISDLGTPSAESSEDSALRNALYKFYQVTDDISLIKVMYKSIESMQNSLPSVSIGYHPPREG